MTPLRHCFLLPIFLMAETSATLVGCPTIPVPVHGQATGVCTNSQVGDSCRFQCQPGYRLLGSVELRCKSNTKWTDFVPLCQLIQCLGVWAPSGGSVSCTGSVPGDTCLYACDQGLLMEGANTAICQADGTWSDFPPVCKKIACPTLYPDPNGAMAGSCESATIGETCQFSCNRDYDLVGHNQVVCSAEGQWSWTPPYCEKYSEIEVELVSTPKPRKAGERKPPHRK